LSAKGAYLYGVVVAGDLGSEALADQPSVDGGHAVRVVSYGRVAAILSDVSLDEFDEATLPARLNDIEWLERSARAHEGVLERALDAGGVVPFRLCTVYRSEEALGQFVVEREAELLRVLDRVAGRVELGVKGLVARDEPEADTDTQSGTGLAYMQERQRRQADARQRAQLIRTCADLANARFKESAIAAAMMAVRPPDDNAEEAMFLNAAYLVRADDDAVVHEAAALTADYAGQGIRFEVTGPWPAFNFVPPEVAS